MVEEEKVKGLKSQGGEVEEECVDLLPASNGDSRVMAEKVSVTLRGDYQAFEERLTTLPKLRFDPGVNRLVLEESAVTDTFSGDPARDLAKAFGLSSRDAALLLANLSVKSVVDTRKPASCEPMANAVLGLIADSHPQDAVEAMICSLITAATIQAAKAMDAGGKQKPSPLSSNQADSLAVPIRMMSTTAKLVEALSRYRRRGEQKVVVHHVSSR